MNKLIKILRTAVLVIVALILVTTLGLVIWANVRAQPATARAVTILQENAIVLEDGLWVFRPDTPNNKGLIYYPGGLVEPEAYAGTAQGIADAGYLVVIPKMPLNLAFTGINKADAIREAFPEITAWVIGGHSLGGAMAAEYAKNHTDSVDGLIFFASYPANYAEFVDFPIPILAIIGSNDPGSVEQRAFYDVISDTASLAIIEGGNHKQYADYPFQADDGIPTITSEEQQAAIVAAAVAFMDGLE